MRRYHLVPYKVKTIFQNRLKITLKKYGTCTNPRITNPRTTIPSVSDGMADVADVVYVNM